MKPTYASFFANLSNAERHSTISKPPPPPPPQTRLATRGRGRGRNFGRPQPTPQIARPIPRKLRSPRVRARAIYRTVTVPTRSIYRALMAQRFQRMGLTENNSATYLTSDNPCLDFFFHVVPDAPPESVHARLKLAWEHDPLKALKLVCNLRGVRGTGKTDKENFYAAALWMHENHPKTLGCNVETFAKFGYFKDLPEILFRLLEGPNVRKERKAAWCPSKRGKGEVRKAYFLAKKGKEDNDRRKR